MRSEMRMLKYPEDAVRPRASSWKWVYPSDCTNLPGLWSPLVNSTYYLKVTIIEAEKEGLNMIIRANANCCITVSPKSVQVATTLMDGSWSKAWGYFVDYCIFFPVFRKGSGWPVEWAAQSCELYQHFSLICQYFLCCYYQLWFHPWNQVYL